MWGAAIGGSSFLKVKRMAQVFTLVNRTSKTLNGTWDGRTYDLTPGKHSFPEIQAVKFKDQNPLMGSLDPYTGNMIYLIGIEDLNDDCSPIEQSDAIEQWDRKKLGGLPVEVRPASGIPFANERHNPLTKPGSPVDSTFTDHQT